MGRLFDSKQFRTDLQLSGSFSGSFEGSGANLTNIPASAIGGLNLSQIASGSFSASISQNGGLSVNTDITASSLTVNGNILLPDGGAGGPYIGLGDAKDLKIFHNGNHSIVRETGAGSLYLQSDNNVILSKDSNTELMIKGIADGAVELYHDNVKKFETTADGIYITGSITASDNISANSIDAVELNVTHFTASFITASTLQTSGSNIFGDEPSDTHTFVGDIIAQNNISSSGYISGSVFSGDGSGLINIPASGITGLNLSQIASGSVTASIAPDKGFQVNTDTEITGSLTVSGSAHNFIGPTTFDLSTGNLTLANSVGGKIYMSTTYNSEFRVFDVRYNNGNNTGIKLLLNKHSTGAGALEIYHGGTSKYVDLNTNTNYLLSNTRFGANSGTAAAKVDIVGNLNVTTDITASGIVSASAFIGDGNSLTNISSTSLNGISLGNSTVVGDGASSATSYGNAFGKSATSTGGQNVAVGAFSNAKYGGISIGQSVAGGSQTVAIGYNAGHTNGENNVLVGYQPGTNTSGDYNISLGYFAGYDQTSGAGNITIGSGSRGVAGESNQLRIGHGLHGAIISGSLATGDLIFSNNVTLNGGTLSIKNQGAQSEARFYCEVSNAHYTALKAQPHSLYSGNPVTLLPAYDFDFAKPHFQANITASGDISGSATSTASFGTYLGDGSQLDGITPPSGIFGISDSSGSFTYYSDLSSSLQAATAGDTIQLFANHTEASDHIFHLKDKVDFNFNGNELFISASATLDGADMISDNDIAVSCSFYNGRIRFTQGTTYGIFNRLLYIDNAASEINNIGFEWEVETGTNASPYYPIRNDGTLIGGKFIGGPSVFGYLIQTYGTLKHLDVYASTGILFNGYLKKHYNLNVHTYGGQAAAEATNTYVYDSYFHAETGQALSAFYVINCTIIADNGAGVSGTRRLINSTIRNANGIGASLTGEMIGGSVYTENNVSIAAGDSEVLGSTIYNRDYLGPGVTVSNGEISNCAIIDDYPYSGQKSIEVNSGATSPTITNCSFDFLNNSTNNVAITAIDDDTPVFFANNTFKNCTPTNPTKVIQAISNVPDQQGNVNVSSSLDNNRIYSGSFSGSYVGDGSGLTGVEAFPFSGSAVITGSLTVSGSVVDFTSASAVNLNIESIPLINPQVEYVNCAAITASGATVSLPNSLTFVSSSIYEYIEIFINGLRMRYDVDFAPRSTSTIQYFVTIPSGSEVTYKSLKRP